jgi:hypothetical protein
MVMAVDFLGRIATDAVENGEETSFVTQGGCGCVDTGQFTP